MSESHGCPGSVIKEDGKSGSLIIKEAELGLAGLWTNLWETVLSNQLDPECDSKTSLEQSYWIPPGIFGATCFWQIFEIYFSWCFWTSPKIWTVQETDDLKNWEESLVSSFLGQIVFVFVFFNNL
jgi:hypothetical protein